MRMFSSSALNNGCGNCTEAKISGNFFYDQTHRFLSCPQTYINLWVNFRRVLLLQTTAKYSAVKCCSENENIIKIFPHDKIHITVYSCNVFSVCMNLYTNEFTVTGAKDELLCITVHNFRLQMDLVFNRTLWWIWIIEVSFSLYVCKTWNHFHLPALSHLWLAEILYRAATTNRISDCVSDITMVIIQSRQW